MPDPLKFVNLRQTSQAEQADPRQSRNLAGGWAFTVDRTARLHRFLTIGTEGGTYYASEQAITKDNAAVVLDWARNSPAELVTEVVKISQAGRAPRNNPALFALAAAAGLGDDAGRKAALAALPQVARTGTHLFTFTEYVQQFRGWGRGLRNAVGDWYLDKDPGDAAYQAIKYRQRNGWTHRDVLRLSHPFTGDAVTQQSLPHKALFDFICGRDHYPPDLPPIVQAYREAQVTESVPGWVRLIEDNPALSWEMLPDQALGEAKVWHALIDAGMPQTALMRQLPRLTRLGVVGPQSPATTAKVAAQLLDPARLNRARVHPVNVLVALKTYASGHSLRGDTSWEPVRQITDALDAAFYAAFGAVEPAGKRTMLALDVSGSMGALAAGLPVTCREVTAALALVTAATEPEYMICGFTSAGGWSNFRDTGLTVLNVSPRQRLDDVLRTITGLSFGATDCSLPMTEALKRGWEFDTMIVMTDSETWHGDIHPHQALRQYRERTGINTRLAVVAITPTEFTVADPADPGTLDLSGFDSAVPQLLADFSRGDI